MRIGWRFVLPIVGLILFGWVTVNSLHLNRGMRNIPNRYFWWATFPLDSDPLNMHRTASSPCEIDKENCATWDLRAIWVDPGWQTEALEISAVPAFVAGAIIVFCLSRLGVNEIWTFFVSMPLLISGWYYFVGLFVDRWSRRLSNNR